MMSQEIAKPNRGTPNKRPKKVAHDDTPSGITDHAFEPKAEWWTLCKHCNLAASAHAETVAEMRFYYYSDDNPEE